MSNPFEAEDGQFRVLVNEEGQYSLWPAQQKIPAGWTPALDSTSREECLAWVDAHWTDMRPRSLAAELADAADS
jgi:MbtH protein